MVANKYRTRVLAMARSTSYLMELPHVISQMRRSREKKLENEIQALRNRYGYSLGYRPIHALLVNMGRSVSTGTIIHSEMGFVFKSEHYKNAAKRAGLVQRYATPGCLLPTK